MSESGGETHLGIVKFYNPRKGYGFVTRAEGQDVFFHLTHFRTMATPVPGNVVRFRIGQNREGLTAEDIVIVPSEELECYGGTITSLTSDGGSITTPDNFEVQFLRSDFIPHTRADGLRLGDEVEMHFLFEEPQGTWQAKVVRPPDFRPEDSAPRSERRDADEEEENRRLLGILYKTDLDDEALHAARTLCERNMRATLSALVSRVLDRRLEQATRRELVKLVPQIYFDDQCQGYLEAMAASLDRVLDEEERESSPSAASALRLLFDEEQFPLRWSQYLLPFGLSLLRDLSAVPSCHTMLQDAECAESAERWLTRVCRHVEQKRSGHGYVMTTALATFDEVWQRDALHEPLERVLSRLLVAVDGEGLANQIYHLRDKLSADFMPVFLPQLSHHPDLPAALRSPVQSEVFSQWIETLLRSAGETLSTEMLATVLPLIEEVRTHLSDDAAINRMLRPVTESLTPEEVVRLLTTEDLPERAIWATLRHLDRRGELNQLLANPEVRGLVTDWLRRTSQQPQPEPPREQEVNTALKLIDSLRSSSDLQGELSDIGHSLFASLHDRVARADSRELMRLLDEFDSGSLPHLTADLARRLRDPSLDEPARRQLMDYFQTAGPPLDVAAFAVARWTTESEDPARINEVIAALEQCREASRPEAGEMAGLLSELLASAEVGWHDGFVTELTDSVAGPAARLEGFAILLPTRLFRDPADYGMNRFVRLIHRRGMAIGVVSAPVPETGYVCGRLAGPLAIDERNAMVGELVDCDGERCYFEVAQMRSGQDQALQEGDLMRFTRVEAAGEQAAKFVAFNVHRSFSEADLPLLWETFSGAADEAVALAAGREALRLSGETVDEAARGAWSVADPARREALLASEPEGSWRGWLEGAVGSA